MNQDLSKGRNKKPNHLPHWLRQMADAEETPDWLRRLAQESAEIPDTTASPAVQPDEPVERVFAEPETPDWPGDQAELSEQQKDTQELAAFLPPEEEPEAAPAWFAETADRGEEQTLEPVPTPSVVPPAEKAEPPDWLADISDQAVTEVPEAATSLPAEEAELPAWLVSMGIPAATGEPQAASLPSEEEPELPDWLVHIDEAEIKEPTASAPDVKEAEIPAWLSAIEEEKAEEPPTAAPAEEAQEGLPDWLAGVEEPQPAGALDWLTGIDETETGQDIPAWLADIDGHAQAEEAEPSPVATVGEPAQEEISDWSAASEQAASEAEEADWLATVGQETEEEGVPDWLAGVDLDQVGEEQGQAEQMAFAPSDQDGIADWLTGDREPIEEGTPGLLADIEEPQPESVPDWLQDVGIIDIEKEATTTDEQVLAREGEPALPAWLEGEDFGESEVDADFLQEIMAAEPTADQGARPQEARPRKKAADVAMPTGAATLSWIEKLRAQARRTAVKESSAETSGPLSGLRGLLAPEPILAQVPESEYKPVPFMPESHQVEAKLFDQVLALPADRPVTITQPLGQLVLASLGRWALYLALITIIVAAAFLPDPLSTLISAPEMAETSAFYNAVKGLPQESAVLLVIDYDASLDGELTPATRAVVRHLLHNQVGIVAVSLNPQGTAIVQELFEESSRSNSGEHFINLGYLPPHPASLYAFINNPVSGVTLFGTQQDPAQTMLGSKIAGLDALDLVVTVSGNQEHVRWWIEQIGSQYDIDIVSAVSSSIAPYIQPYYASAQVKGMLIGLAGTADYEKQLAPQVVLDYAQNNLLLQGYAQLLLVVILILSGITFFARGRK